MTTTITVNTAVDRILKDGEQIVSTTDIDSFIENEALQIYSKHKPLIKTADLSASSSYDYELSAANFTSWIDGFSDIKEVEYPTGSQIPNIIPTEEWMIYETASTKYLRFRRTTPSSGTIRVTYTVPYEITDSASTIKDNDVGAFANLASSLCAGVIARKYGQTSDSTIGADAVAYRDKSDVWASRSKDLFKLYIDFIFPKELDAAFAQKEFDTIYSSLGYSRLTHPEWSR